VQPVILDVDTGVDDACALLLAARHTELDLLAVTCVAGNARLPDVARNTLTVLQACGRTDVPVALGAGRPLRGPAGEPRPAHGADGMADLGWPVPALQPDPRPAVELIRDTLVAAADAGRPVTLVTLGPLTNVAMLLQAHPRVARALSAIVAVGGAFGAGVDAAGEFNVRHDPEAAAITLAVADRLGVPVTMYGLDVFYRPTVSRRQAARLVGIGGRSPAELAGRLISFQSDRFGAGEATIGDAGAVCAVVDPGGLTADDLPVRVDLTGRRGRTLVERRRASDSPPAVTVSVALGVDGPRYADLWLRTVG
jgi:inosine-uridine nucleoside N-ribohydrolase